MRFLASASLLAVLLPLASAQGWPCYGGNSQHTAVFQGQSQSASAVHWAVRLEDDPSYYNYDGELLIHYASPVISPGNTVVYGYRFTTQVNNSPDYDNWEVIARNSVTGLPVWTQVTGYSAALIWPKDWTSVFPFSLVTMSSNTTGVAMAGAGGSIITRSNVDSSTATLKRLVFYTTLADYTANASTYSVIKINTPITPDSAGNIYFGYIVTGSLPTALANSLGTGGVVKMNATTGAATYATAASLLGGTGQLCMNASPAVSNDGSAIYCALCSSGGNSAGYLVKVSTANLGTLASVAMIDPANSGPAVMYNESSASPMVAPDGHVFMGVMRNNYGESHGWMLQYDGNLSGTAYPAGAFGWDDTPSVVPASCVPSYKGSASYLICTKYNDYANSHGSDSGAVGDNHVAILDPTSNSTSRDRQSGIPVMNEVELILGPTPDKSEGIGVCEWCINSAAIDVASKSAIINSEDGHTYRWDLTSNLLTQEQNLEPPTGEAYTSTVIGPDGTIYAINDSVLFAIGNTLQATAVSVLTGTNPTGSLPNIWAVDGSTYSVTSVASSASQTAAIEADFVFNNTTVSYISATAVASGIAGATCNLSIYNYVTQQWDPLGSGQAMSATQTQFKGSTTKVSSDYFGSGGTVRISVQATCPTKVNPNPFTLSADMITCGGGR